MKRYFLLILSLCAVFTLSACESMPDKAKDDGREAADRAKANAEEAYDDMKDDM